MDSQGTSRDNPLYIGDQDDVVPFVPDRRKTTVYVELDSDGGCTELPAEAVPTLTSARSGRSRKSANVSTGSPSFKLQQASSRERSGLHSPSVKPSSQATIVTRRGDKHPASESGEGPQASRITPSIANSTSALPPPSSLPPFDGIRRLPGRSKPPGPLKPALQPSRIVASPTTSEDTISGASVGAARGETRKNASRMTTTVPNSSVSQIATPFRASTIVPAMPAQGDTTGNSIGGASVEQRGLLRHRHLPSHHSKNGPEVLQVTNVSQTDNQVPRQTTIHPIGSRADSQREQTTIGRVDTDATLTSRFERVEITNEATKDAPNAVPSVRARKSGLSEALMSRPKALKRALSPPRQKTFHQPSRGIARDHASSKSSVQVPQENLHDANALNVRNTTRETSEITKSNFERQVKDTSCSKHVPSKELSKDTSSSRRYADHIEMGSQLSAAAVIPDPVLRFVEASTGDLDKPNLLATRTEAMQSPADPSSRMEASDLRPLFNLPERPVNMTDQALTDDLETARENTEHCLGRHLDDQYEDHAYFVKSTMWRQRTCYEREMRAQSSGRKLPSNSVLPEIYIQATSPFAIMSAIQVPFEKSTGKERLKDITQEVFLKGTPKDMVVRSSWTVPSITYKDDSVCIPPFKEYTSLKSNILADNESKLLTMPYLGEDGEEEAQEALVNKLPQIYEIRHDINALSDLRDEQCRFYSESINSFLDEVGLTWDMILFWLLAQDMEIRDVNRKSSGHRVFERLLLDRSAFDKEFFQRDDRKRNATLFVREPDRWRGLLRRLKEPSASQLRLAALACSAIFTKCNFSPWYLARQSETMQAYVHEKTTAAQDPSKFSFRSIACRVCYEHNCLFHGEIREDPESDLDFESEHDSEDDETDVSQIQSGSRPRAPVQEDESSLDGDTLIPAHVIEDDSDVDRVINYRVPVNPEVLAADPAPGLVASKQAIPPHGPFNAKWWARNKSTVEWEKRKPFIPCAHDGSCTSANCRCFREGVNCEKTCKCPSSCNRRFPGCTCSFDALDGEPTCRTVKGCLCVKFKRECDADLCGTCGATEILDPVNRYNEEALHDRCTNVGIQRGVPKKTLLGQSEVHGFGLYAGQDIKKDDIIGEYTGEIISVEESGRRAIIYEYEKNMYLFKLNKKQEVDATYMGNKLRFINNANKNLTNCYPKVLLCNTVFRVALYASVDIKAGTEFFFHYNYPEETTMHFKQPKSKVVAVKQTRLVTTKQKRMPVRASSFNSAEPSGPNPYARQIEALAKARAAKAAKRAAQLAELGLPATGRITGVRQARKSATNPPLESRLSKNSEVRGRDKTAPTLRRDEDVEASESALDGDEETSAKTWGTNEAVTELVVQDTDDEDDEFVPESTQEGAEADSMPADAAEDDLDSDTEGQIEQGPSKPPGRAIKSAAVFVVKKKKGKLGGARPGAGRKRKRPLIVNSDDE